LFVCLFVRLLVGWRQDNGNRSNQESKFDFLATHQLGHPTHQCLVKIDEGQLGWCREREKIDWQEPHKFDCNDFYFLLSLVRKSKF